MNEKMKPTSPIKHFVKRSIDFIAAMLLLIVFSPLLIVISVLILVTMGRPVFFTQVRPGYQNRPFHIVKFRTMRAPQPDEVWFRTDGQRLTKLGAFFRKTSIDELPELINVIKGEMSLVGPRPLLMEYLPKYTAEQMRRHDVRPGVTGWAQINGRQNITFSKRLELDVWYVDNWSLWLDFQILFRTIGLVLFSRGVESGQDVDIVDDIGLSPDRNLRKDGKLR